MRQKTRTMSPVRCTIQRDQIDISLFHHPVGPVEAPVEGIGFSVGVLGAQVEGALGRFQGQGVQGADHGGGGDHQGKLAKELAGDARHKGRRQKDRDEHQGDAHNRAGQFAHGLDGRIVGGESCIDIVRGVFHNDDGVVHHDADGQNQGKQGHEIDREAEQSHGGKGADDGDRHGGGGHQGGPEVLEEDHDDDEHQDAGFIQGVVHRVDGIADKHGGVVINAVFQAGREMLAHRVHGLAHLPAHIDGIGARQRSR